MFYLFLFVTPLLVAQEETATVVFYRTHNKFYRAGKPIVRCDGAPIGRIGNGAWWSVEIPTGRRQLTAGDDQLGRSIDLRPGQTYYFAITYHNAAMVSDQKLWQIAVIPDAEAKLATAQLKHSEIK